MPLRFFLMIYLLSVGFLIGYRNAQATYAPVVNAWSDPMAMKSRYRVQKDDTIYSIALAFDLDYKDLAKANHLSPPYILKPGQTLTMEVAPAAIADEESSSLPPEKVITYPVYIGASKEGKYIEVKPKAPPKPVEAPTELILPELELRPVDYQSFAKFSELERIKGQEKASGPIKVEPIHKGWQYPATGRIAKAFCLDPGGNKGVDIEGQLGNPIKATAGGKIVYSGCGLKGYGNLIIIKHSDNYLSAYAYNKKLLVKEGDTVKGGDQIATMGQNNAGKVMLHFEIRHNGKPVNPLLYL